MYTRKQKNYHWVHLRYAGITPKLNIIRTQGPAIYIPHSNSPHETPTLLTLEVHRQTHHQYTHNYITRMKI